MLLRFGGSLGVGVLVTLLLFYIMQALIQSGREVITKGGITSIVDFVRVKAEQAVETKKRKAEKPPPPDVPPPDVRPQISNVAVTDTGYTMANVEMAVNVQVGSGGFGVTDGEYLPIVKVQPVYPRRALSRGMSGWVIVEFTVTSQGTVRDPVVVSNCAWVATGKLDEECADRPSDIFDSAATAAAEKFKYKPKVIDGVPVDTAGVQNKITFILEDEG